MTNNNRARLSKLAFAVAIAIGSVSALAQNTTSAVGGRITSVDGKAVAGAQVTILHKDSGSVNSTTTDADGRYSARGLRTGGPYTITITKDGIVEKRENVYLQLAETASVDAKLGGATQAVDTIVVTGQNIGSDKFSNTAMGASTSIGRAELDAFASVQRNLQDYARIDPRVSQTDKERGEISAGGQNSRYNSLTIDGVTTNDTFGLEANNAPTAKQPISIDAIQSVQINVSNYDVTQKGYTGANINAVTKSGTNDFKGSIYYVTRDDKLVGQRYNRTTDTYLDAPAFKENTKGVTLGGPIIKDKLFFFVSYEELESTRSSPDFGPLGSNKTTTVAVTPEYISAAAALASSKYGMNIGTADTSSAGKLKVKDTLAKLDWNINAQHRASLRYAKTEQTEPQFPDFFANQLTLSSHLYTQVKEIETIVGQWFADWTPTFSTEVKFSDRDYKSKPVNTVDTPEVKLNVTGQLPPGAPASLGTGSRGIIFGTERSRHFNNLATKTKDSYVGANWTLGTHELKFGSDYSDNKVFNAFLQNTKGNYTFACVNSSATFTYTFGSVNCTTSPAALVEQATLENFNRGRPTSYVVQVAAPGQTLADGVANFTMKNLGVFLQDTWSINSNLTVSAGVRLDSLSIPEKPLANAAAAAAPVAGSISGNTVTRQTGGFGLDNTKTIDGSDLFQPRVGFNYTFDSARPTQLRGGFGLFQGAAANVWFANQFQNNGIATRQIGCGTLNFSACPTTGGLFSADPNAQPTNFGGNPPAAIVDFIDPNLRQPSVWKANLGFEHELPFGGVVFGLEYLYTKTKQGVWYKHLNLGAPTRTGTDGRELYYTPQSYAAACWTGFSLSTAGACAGGRAAALSNAGFTNVLLATTTDKGGGNLATVSLSRPMTKGWAWSASYTYTSAKEVSPLTSSVALSNFQSRSILNPNEEVSANSAYLVKNRLNGTMNWQYNFFGSYKTQLGLFAEVRKGKPYSWTIENDMNGDGTAGNDLMYIPKAPGSGEVVFAGDTATDHSYESAFWEFVNSQEGLRDYKGRVVDRNSSFAPWTNSVDMRISQELPGFLKGHKSVFVLDLLNVGNMLNKKWGHIDEVAFQSAGGLARSFVQFGGLDASGRYIYRLSNVVREDFVTRQARGESQWAVQATFRYEF